MPPTRNLRIPPEAEIRRTFDRWRRPPPVLRDFMHTIAPIVDNDFITCTIALAVTHISSMRPERKIQHLDNLLDEVNFPREVAREINNVIDHIEPPPEFYRVAQKFVPPLTTLTAAMRQPRNPIPRQAHQEAVTSFTDIRNQFVKDLAYGFVSHTVAHESQREEGVQRAVDQIGKRIRRIDLASAVCDFTLRSPAWQERTVTPLMVVTLLNAAKARDAEVQQKIDENIPISDARSVRAIIDDLAIAHCERAINTRSPHLQPFAFWEEATRNAPSAP